MRTISKSAVVLALVAACGGPVACSSSGGDDSARPQGLAARLEKDTGVPWSVYDDAQAQAVRFLAPQTPVKTSGATPEEAARAFFDRYRDALHGSDAADELRLVPKNDAITTEDDGPYLRFEHYLAGTDVRVFDIVSTARFTNDGALMWLQSGFRGGLGAVPRTAVISGPDAVTKATATSSEVCGLPGPEDAPPASTLGVSFEGGAPRLVWRVQVMQATESCATPLVTIDATTGELVGVRDGSESLWDTSPGVRYEALGEKSNLRVIDVTAQTFSPLSGKYLMLTEGFPKVNTTDYGSVIYTEITTDTLGSWDTSSAARGAAADAHFNVMHALRYFKENHNRNSTTGLGNGVNVVMHYPFKRPDGSLTGNNAASAAVLWLLNQVQCGDGDYLSGGNRLPPCSAFDAVAHEIAHGVTRYTSHLTYQGESGALNESFSDAMGASAENALEVKDPARNFLIGERYFKDGRGVRDMQNPTRDGFVDHYDDFRKCPGPSEANDQCFVHSNSGIPNRAFSLMTAGGVHRSSGLGVARGIDFKAARELWYDTFTKLGPDANFKTAALAQVTESLKRGPEIFQAVACAWYAVGVINLGLHPALVGLACPAPPVLGVTAPAKSPDCQGRDNGWFCSDNVKNSAVHCKGGAADTGAFCADPDQTCKKAAVDDWTATVSATGEVSCQ